MLKDNCGTTSMFCKDCDYRMPLMDGSRAHCNMFNEYLRVYHDEDFHPVKTEECYNYGTIKPKEVV